MRANVPNPELADAAPGDRVHIVLEDGLDPVEVTKRVQELTGAEVFIAPPLQSYGADRLGLGNAAGAVETARAYAQTHGGELDVTQLLAVFAEVTDT
jgi:hypothetical protein